MLDKSIKTGLCGSSFCCVVNWLISHTLADNPTRTGRVFLGIWSSCLLPDHHQPQQGMVKRVCIIQLQWISHIYIVMWYLVKLRQCFIELVIVVHTHSHQHTHTHTHTRAHTHTRTHTHTQHTHTHRIAFVTFKVVEAAELALSATEEELILDGR